MRMYENAVLSRDCQAVQIPSGQEVTLNAGTSVTITQSLGGSYTVMVGFGSLARIGDRDADALGKPVPQYDPTQDESKTLDERIDAALRTCYDPEIPVNIVELGLVYDCKPTPMEEGGYRVDIRMTLTAPGCGMGEVLASDVRRKLLSIRDIRAVDVDVVFDPPWDRAMMSEAAKLELGLF